MNKTGVFKDKGLILIATPILYCTKLTKLLKFSELLFILPATALILVDPEYMVVS